jgi:hypothetical protein
MNERKDQKKRRVEEDEKTPYTAQKPEEVYEPHSVEDEAYKSPYVTDEGLEKPIDERYKSPYVTPRPAEKDPNEPYKSPYTTSGREAEQEEGEPFEPEVGLLTADEEAVREKHYRQRQAELQKKAEREMRD